MSRLLTHRGPDDDGVFVDPGGRVALGARRLAIIDVANGHQPLSNEDGTVWAVLNGEIYNHPDLIAELRRAGHTFTTRCDTEVLVHLYEECGTAMVHALEGMFAFAIWDSVRGRLVLARDRFGEKPLFVRRDAEGLEFASELSPLIETPGSGALRPSALDTFFVFGYVPGPETVIEGVEQIPQGSLLVYDVASGEAELQHYWTPPRQAVRRGEPVAELQAETLRLLERSLERTLVSDVPVGAFISGGVDSTLITALLARMSPEPPRTFTVGYDIGDVSELEAARQTADVLGTRHHEVLLTQRAVRDTTPDLLGSLDQPLADPALVAMHAVSAAAREHVKVVVGGQGADELFGGYPRYLWLRRSLRLQQLLPGGPARLGASLIGAAVGTSRVSRLSRVADVLDPQPILRRHLGWVTAHRSAFRARLYGERLSHLRDSEHAIATLNQHLDGAHDLGIGDLMTLDRVHWLPDDVLTMCDRAGMLVGLEMRTPYLNRELAEFATTIAPATHIDPRGKRLLRGALATLVPRKLTWRRKLAFRAPADEWLRGPLHESAREHLLEGRLTADGWFNAKGVAELLNDQRDGIDRSAILWPLYTLGCWLDAKITA